MKTIPTKRTTIWEYDSDHQPCGKAWVCMDNIFRRFREFEHKENWLNVIFVIAKNNNNKTASFMTKILTKQVQNKMSSYFSNLLEHLYKPEVRCVREMVTEILENGTLLTINC